jgi:hypothetical protein
VCSQEPIKLLLLLLLLMLSGHKTDVKGNASVMNC